MKFEQTIYVNHVKTWLFEEKKVIFSSLINLEQLGFIIQYHKELVIVSVKSNQENALGVPLLYLCNSIL